MIVDSVLHKILKRKDSLFANDLKTFAPELTQKIAGKSILVIGGAGTIGSSFLKAALEFKPAKIVVVDINENGLTELVRDIRSTSQQYVPAEFLTYPVSFDSPVFKKLFIAHGPFNIVANFAAHKHVRSEKDIYSIEALLQNNLIHARDLLDILLEYPPDHFFCVSTDKAANPVNVMGASKKMMEELILSYSHHFKIATARFANVAFSNGSLLEGFLKRIERKQPLSSPSDVKRFFVTPKESGQICLMACILGNTAEIFFPKLDMQNDLVNFADIFPVLLESLGYSPLIFQSEEEARNATALIDQHTYPVYVFKSETSGEKLYEEFYTDDEQYDLEKFQALGVISKKPTYTQGQLHDMIDELKKILGQQQTTKGEIVDWLKKYIPEFEHMETGLSLDKKM